MHITFVKKIFADGTPCRKCAEVERRLEEDGLLDRIDTVAIADERDPDSEGMRLAREHGAERAPFFLVRHDSGADLYTVYLKFRREIFGRSGSAQDEARDLLDTHSEIDLL